jgi:hypothetical protein
MKDPRAWRLYALMQKDGTLGVPCASGVRVQLFTEEEHAVDLCYPKETDRIVEVLMQVDEAAGEFMVAWNWTADGPHWSRYPTGAQFCIAKKYNPHDYGGSLRIRLTPVEVIKPSLTAVSADSQGGNRGPSAVLAAYERALADTWRERPSWCFPGTEADYASPAALADALIAAGQIRVLEELTGEKFFRDPDDAWSAYHVLIPQQAKRLLTNLERRVEGARRHVEDVKKHLNVLQEWLYR